MLLWGEDVVAQLTAAADRARAGRPTVLLVSGDPGYGKSSCLNELLARTPDFTVMTGEGTPEDPKPFGLLDQLGVVPPRGTDGALPTLMSAAGAVRDRLDRLALSGPVLLRLDDLHWADAESVEALAWMLRRTAGDRLLVAAATRDFSPGRFRAWDSWVAGSSHVVRLTLRGLSLAAVDTLVRQRWPEVSADLVHRLWRHTSGNPLYLTTLLDEQDPADLAAAQVLPAPAGFSRSIGLRVGRVSPAARDALFAAAVLGNVPSGLADVGAVGALDPGLLSGAAQELADADLVRLRMAGAAPVISFVHALVHAAVYLQAPLPLRRDLHARAAGVVSSESAVLAHLVGAADQYDADLADHLETFAAARYAVRSFREAATHLRASSRLTAVASRRERRWLEAVFCSVMARDFAAVAAELDDVRAAAASPERAVVLAALAVAQRRSWDAVTALEPFAALPLADFGGPVRYRAEVLLAWARSCVGYDTAAVAEGLARAEAVAANDAGVTGLETVARGQVRARQVGAGGILADLDALPQQPAAVPAQHTPALAWRGTLRASIGLTREAVTDLREVTRRIEDGVTDLGVGSFHAFLGLSQWLDGDWPRARISLRKAMDITGAYEHPMVLALAPLADIGEGRFADADSVIARAVDDVLAAPWPEACGLVLTTLIIRAHAAGDAAEQAALLAGLRGTSLQPPEVGRASPVLLLHLGQAFVWGGELDAARAVSARLAEVRPQAGWIPAVRYWLAGLTASAAGDDAGALGCLARARATAGLDLPLYRAHLFADSARLLSATDRHASVALRSRAAELYRALGALPYLRRLDDAPAPQRPALPVGLTERERDVLGLLVRGLSYAQIARELFVTQSTVGYHLGNIYDKVGVRSRHSLTELAATSPTLVTTGNFS